MRSALSPQSAVPWPWRPAAPPGAPHGTPFGAARLARPARLLAALLCAPALAAPDLAGRWEGRAAIPGAPMPIVIDLEPGPGGAWHGSLVLPGRGVKGAPLKDLQLAPDGLRAALDAAFPGSDAAGAVIVLRRDGAMLSGSFVQGGHEAALTLARTGPAQVDTEPPATALDATLHGTWIGRYELAGAPREVTLVLANRPDGLGGGELTIVGKRRTQLPIDRVVQGRSHLRLEASAAGIRIEGRWRADPNRIDAEFAQGPFQAPLVLQRAAERRP